MTTVKQPTANPTNKLTAATLGVALMNVARVIVDNLWPSAVNEAFWIAIDPLVIYLIGYYFIKDEPNVSAPVVVSTPAAPAAP